VVSNQAVYSAATGQHERAERALAEIDNLAFPVTPLGAFLRARAHDMNLCVLFWLGRMARARVFAARVIGAARELAGVHGELGLRAFGAFRLLLEDDAETAWAEWSLARERYPRHNALREATWGVVLALYAGRTDRAEQVLAHSRRISLQWDTYLAPGRAMYL